MIIFVCGEDTYRSKKYLDGLIDVYQEKYPSGFNFFNVNLEEDGLNKFKDLLRTASFFDYRKMIVLRESFSKSSASRDLLEFLKDAKQYLKDEDSVVVIYEKLDKDKLQKINKELMSFIGQQAKLIKEFKILTPAKISQWIQKEFEDAKLKADKDVIESLKFEIGSDLWKLRSEIDKLVGYCYETDRKRVTKLELDKLMTRKLNSDIFKTLDELFSYYGRPRSVQYLEKHVSRGEDPVNLFSMVIYQARSLLMVKDLQKRGVIYADVVKKTGLHPYVVKKIMNQKTMELDDLKAFYQKLLNLEILYKNGIINAQDLILNLAI